MDLRRKLALLNGGRSGASAAPEDRPTSDDRRVSAEAATSDERRATVERLRAALAKLGPSRPSARPEPLERRQTAHGTLHLREQILDPAHRHGRVEIRQALFAHPAHVAALALDPSLGAIDPRNMLLLDTETTGLSGGTGTLPFLVGLGWFEGERLRLLQMVLRQPGEERPILALLSERLAASTLVVTYNGKAFDWPLLRSRWVMNRLRVPEPRPHLDLLHCARRVFRHRVVGARLVQIEQEVLGHHRSHDVAGEEIPNLYFRFLRSRDVQLLAPVLEHNAHDVVLLAALLGEMADQFANGGRRVTDARIQLGLASVAERAGDGQRALAFARAAASSEDRALRAEALVLAARVFRRRGEPRAAAEALERALSTATHADQARIHVDLAKLYEHRLCDPAKALLHARLTRAAEADASHEKRVARLEHRLATVGSARRA